MNEKVLILTPGYPSKENPYTCAFVHTRVKEYICAGFDVSVCLWNPWQNFDDPVERSFEGVKVIEGNIRHVRELLASAGPFDVIVAHMADVPILNVLERESLRSKIVVVFHGGDILGPRYFCHAGRPYFEADDDEMLHYSEGLPKRRLYRRLKDNQAFSWVFVSESLKHNAEDFMGFAFEKNAYVIGNWVREDLFAYCEKDIALRKKIYFCRRFDNEKVYCIDTVMLAIRRLSKRDCFKDLEFHIYGDGNDYERLIEPVLGFDNVKLHRHFTLNSKLPGVLKDFGIGLFPSRYDSQPVAIQESAQSGLVCIGGDIPAVRAIFPQKEFNILINPDSPDELADAIERLYRDPALFTDLSRRMSKRVAEISGREKTIGAELVLVKKLAADKGVQVHRAAKGAEKLLSVIVPSYNMEKYLDVCIGSLVNHDEVDRVEVLVVNDGSKDRTLEIAREWAARYPDTVVAIDKRNGGHGSCVNAAIPVARGRYVRIVDADDWVVPVNLAAQIKRLANETADCVLTYGQYDYVENGQTAQIFQYPNLPDGAARSFDDVQFPGYAFTGYGPTLSTASWKRTILLESKTFILEGVAYADMMWNVLPVRCAKTFVLYNLDIYRYTMGRAGQSISRETVLRKWQDHNKVFVEAARIATEDKSLAPENRKYLMHNLLGEFGCNNIFVLHIACGMPAVENMLLLLQWAGNDDLLREIVQFTCRQNGTSREILLASQIGRSLITQYTGQTVAESSSARGQEVTQVLQPSGAKFVPARGSFFFFVRSVLARSGMNKSARRFIKGILPYGLVRKWQQRIYGM